MDASADFTEEEIPERSNLWLAGISRVKIRGEIFDRTSAIVGLSFSLFSFVIFWPIISQINFEEAFFTPLTPFLISIFGFFGVWATEALKVLFITSFMISTVGVYLLTLDLTRRQITAILAAVIYLIPPIPVFVLTFIRTGVLETELGSAKSFFTIVYGDGAHFLALAMIPFACIFVLRYLRLGIKTDLIISTILCVLILLANASQSLGFAFIAAMIFLTQLFFGNSRAKLMRFLTIVIFPVGLVSFWYTPHFWYLGMNYVMSALLSNIDLLFPLPFILFLLALFFSFVFFARREDRMAIFFCFLVFLVFLGIVGVWLISGRSFVPHPHRMLPDLNMFGAIIISLLLSMFLDRVEFVGRVSKKILSMPARIISNIGFGVLSFLVLTVVAYIMSPVAIVAVWGPTGIWSKIRLSVLSDRQETLSLAGGNFKLISERGDSWQIWFGIFVSVFFLIIMILLAIRSDRREAVE